MRQRQGAEFRPFPTPAPWDPNSAPPGRATPEITQKMQCNEPPCPETVFRFGVLQLQLYRFEITHFEVVATKVGYLDILQNRMCALFIL
jgi:hypothetical protein